MKDIVYSNKLVTIYMLAILVFGQIALAMHSAVHFDHGLYEKIVQADNASHSDSKPAHLKHQCPECLLTHAFHAADIPVSVYVPLISFVRHTINPDNLLFSGNIFILYEATGPPSISL